MLQIRTKGIFGNNPHWPYRTGYPLEARDKSRARSGKEGRKLGRQNTYVLATLVSNYYLKESGVERNAGYRRKFDFEEENVYKGRT